MDNEKQLLNQPYLPILSKISSQITWLTFAILIIIGTNTFLLYQNHFGALKAYVARGEYNEANPNLLKDVAVKDKESVGGWVAERVKYYKALETQSRVITLPILGIPLIDRDFFILYLILGIVFLLWLFTLLKYTKNFLESLLNEYHYPSDSDANTIQSLFFLIMPTDYTSKRYHYYELVFVFFVVSIVLLVFSDVWDIFLRVNRFGISTYQDPSFKFMAAHLIVSYIITALCLGIAIFLHKHLRTTLKHIRNMLILLRWNRIALFPVLYEFADKKNKPLIDDKNFIEYRVCDDSNYSKLVILLSHQNTDINEIKAVVDLPHSVRQFYKNHKTTRTEFDEKLGRTLTIEESFMRDYFRKIMDDRSYEPELVSETLKINKRQAIN